MRIEQFDPAADMAALRACHQMFEADRATDYPELLGLGLGMAAGRLAWPGTSFRDFAGWWACGFGGEPRETWLATGSTGRLAGCYLLELPDRDNTGAANFTAVTALAARRAGTGRELLRHGAARAAAAGRTVLAGATGENCPGEAFARAAGARHTETEVRSVMDLAGALPARLAGLREQSAVAATGYSLLSWTGPVPASYLGQVASVTSAMADAPRSPGLEPEVWDGERVRASERRVVEQGLRFYSVAARCEATGELAALTQLSVDPDVPGWGLQEQTVVPRAHRGHRLGLRVKVAMLELLAAKEPQVCQLLTATSSVNAAMMAINEALGYRAVGRALAWELDVASVPQRDGQS